MIGDADEPTESLDSGMSFAALCVWYGETQRARIYRSAAYDTPTTAFVTMSSEPISQQTCSDFGIDYCVMKPVSAGRCARLLQGWLASTFVVPIAPMCIAPMPRTSQGRKQGVGCRFPRAVFDPSGLHSVGCLLLDRPEAAEATGRTTTDGGEAVEMDASV